MDDRFDREFYRSGWQRVLPLGPHGIQPYVGSPCNVRGLGLYGLVALLGALARRVQTFGRYGSSGIAARPLPLTTAPRVQG